MPNFTKATLAALVAAYLVAGHSWVEQMRNLDNKGQYVGDYGYPRGMVSRTDPNFNDDAMSWRMPEAAGQANIYIDDSIYLCATKQRKQEQSKDTYPRLQTPAGGFMVLRYLENGHVTFPKNQLGKAEKSGTVFIYGTTQPKEDEKLTTVLQWTKDGQGGDKRGVLLGMNDYDDGRCYLINESGISQERQKAYPNFVVGQVGQGKSILWCESTVKLPETAPVGKPYTLYWVWQWNTLPGIDPAIAKGKDEYYSTCMDVDVVSPDLAKAAEAAPPSPKFEMGQQDANSVAVSDWASRTAIITDAIKGEVGTYFSSKATGAPSGAPVSSPTGAPAASPTRTPASSPTGAPAGTPSKPAASNPSVSSPVAKPSNQIRTLSRHPGATPTPPADDDAVTVTDTVVVTVTASPTKAPSSAVTSRAAKSVRNIHGAKFRGRFAAET